MSSIEDIPAEVLVNIFDEVPRDSLDIFETVFKFSSKISSLIEEYKRYDENYHPFIEINEDNVKILCLQEERGKFVHLQLQDYNILAERLVNLHKLHVGWLNLEVAGNPGAWTSFPALEQLFLGYPCAQPGVTPFDPTAQRYDIKGNLKKGSNNLGGLIALLSRSKYPQLATLGLTVIFETVQENMFVSSILNFLLNHQKTLKSLSLLMAANLEKTNPGLLSEDWSHVPNFETRLDQLCLNLDHFAHHFYPYVEAKNFLQLIDRISITQKSFKPHILFYPRYQTFSTEVFEDNYSTLTHVAISICIFETLDCKVFEQCKSLQSLYLLARPKTSVEFEMENYRGEPARSELTNILCLPTSLCHIQFINFFLETQDTLRLTQDHFPNLKTLCLERIGEKENLGCTFEMVSRLMYHGLETIKIYRGFNRRLMQVTVLDDPAFALSKMILKITCKIKHEDHPWSFQATKPDDILTNQSFIKDYYYRDTLPRTAMPEPFLDLDTEAFYDGLQQFLLLL